MMEEIVSFCNDPPCRERSPDSGDAPAAAPVLAPTRPPQRPAAAVDTAHPVTQGAEGKRFEVRLHKPEGGSLQRLEALKSRIAWVIGLGISLLAVYSAALGQFDPIYHRSLVMGASAIGVLMVAPSRQGEGRAARALELLDVLLAVGIAVSIGWFISVYEALETGLYEFSPTDQTVGLVGMLVLLELSRRTMGWPLFLFGCFTIVYCLFGGQLPWIFRHSSFSLEEVLRTFWYSLEGVFGLPASVMVSFIFVFIVFGAILEGTGAGTVLLKIAFSLTGRFRGGPAHAAVAASALFGSISGAVTANVVATGVFTIPMIKRRGFSNDFAGAVETAASSGGQFMPPVMGAVAFIMAELTGISYLTICVAALLPALFYYGSLFCSVALEARRLGIQPIPRAEREVLTRKDWVAAQLFIVPITVIVVVLVLGRSPAMAGFWAIVAALALGAFNPELRRNPKVLVDVLARGGLAGARIMVALGVIGMIIAMMNLTGLGLRFSNMVLSLGDGSLLVSLVLTMLGCLVLGMGMPTVPAYLIIVLVMGPAIQEMGVAPILIHLFVLYFGVLSSITPPVAIAAYAAAPIADSNPIRTGLQAVRLALIGFVIPFVFVYNPSLTLVEQFSLSGFLWVVVRLGLAIWLFSTGFAGVDTRPLPWWERGARTVLGFALLYPEPAWEVGGVLAAVALLARVRLVGRGDAAPAAVTAGQETPSARRT